MGHLFVEFCWGNKINSGGLKIVLQPPFFHLPLNLPPAPSFVTSVGECLH